MNKEEERQRRTTLAKLSKQGQISMRKRRVELNILGAEEKEITGVKIEVLEAEVEDVVVKVEMITKTALPAYKIGRPRSRWRPRRSVKQQW